jgi:thymidylate kinase
VASGASDEARELAAEVAGIVDVAAGGRVIVLGSPPPNGRDLDLLARPPERARVERSLTAAGLAGKGGSFALFKGGRAYGVDLLATERFLDDRALEPLFARALALDGFQWLARPAPGYALLILARLVAAEGELRPKRRARLDRILSEDPRAWEAARAAAPEWHAERALALLARAARGEPPTLRTRLRKGARRLPMRRSRRGVLVGLSGIDGAGKSSQARSLADALGALDVPVEIVWNNLRGNRALDAMAALPKALLALAGRGGGKSMAQFDDAPPGDEPPGDEPPGDEPPGGSLPRRVWSTLATAANALEQRQLAARGLAGGGVVVFDRSPLDLAVRMQVIYRANVAVQRRVVAMLGPKPDVAFLLDIPPAVSLARKDDIWSGRQLAEQAGLYRTLAPQFGVTTLDGQRPAAELAAEIALATWLARR